MVFILLLDTVSITSILPSGSPFGLFSTSLIIKNNPNNLLYTKIYNEIYWFSKNSQKIYFSVHKNNEIIVTLAGQKAVKYEIFKQPDVHNQRLFTSNDIILNKFKFIELLSYKRLFQRILPIEKLSSILYQSLTRQRIFEVGVMFDRLHQ